jgi:peptide chain release factor 2
VRDFSDDIADLTKRVADARAYLKVDELQERLVALEAEASRPDLWDDQEAARRVTTELSSVRSARSRTATSRSARTSSSTTR